MYLLTCLPHDCVWVCPRVSRAWLSAWLFLVSREWELKKQHVKFKLWNSTATRLNQKRTSPERTSKERTSPERTSTARTSTKRTSKERYLITRSLHCDTSAQRFDPVIRVHAHHNCLTTVNSPADISHQELFLGLHSRDC